MKTTFFNLGKQPLANNFLKDRKDFINERYYDLQYSFDHETGLVSLVSAPEKEEIFNDQYPYSTSMSATMRKHFCDAAEQVCRRVPIDSVGLEIGSNDGAFLKGTSLASQYIRPIAIEPCDNFATKTREMGFDTYTAFWDEETAEILIREYGLFDFIYSANCFCHIPDIDQAIKAVSDSLFSDGICVLEDPSLMHVISDNVFEQFYHEHYHVFSVYALNNLFRKYGMEIFKVDQLPNIHGGSHRVWAKKKLSEFKVGPSVDQQLKFEKSIGLDKYETYADFRRKSRQNINELFWYLTGLRDAGEKIVAYGATSKSTVLFNMGLHRSHVDFIIDTTPAKQGTFSPGAHIPVKNGPIPDDCNYVLLTAWNYKEEIMRKEKKFLDRGGTFIVYVPEVTKISKLNVV